MKTTVTIILVLFVSISNMAFETSIDPQQNNTITATFNGFDDEGKLKFTDTKGKIHLFDEVSEDVEIDLYEDDSIGIKYTVTWEVDSIEEYDDEGEPSGSSISVKIITDIKKA